METFKVRDGYDRSKNPRMITVRRMTLAEIKALSGHCEFISRDNKLRTAKVNGNVKTWKREPNRVSVPLKYGMYEYARLESPADLEMLVVRVAETETV